MVDEAYVAALICECDELIASGVVVMIDHCLGKAPYDGFGDIYFLKLVFDVDWSKGNMLTFALWLVRGGITCNEVLIVIRAKGSGVHRP